MKILIHSNAPHVRTGYGVQCAYLAERLHDAGYDVAVSCTYGQQGGISKWRPPHPRNPDKWPPGESVTLYPVGYEVNGNEVIHRHAHHWFDGDVNGGWIIPLLDVWCLVNPMLGDFQVAAWTPVDHTPVPGHVLKFFERTDAVPIAMSRFGENELAQFGLDPAYIPLSVDTQVFKPTPTIQLGNETVTGRQMLGVPEHAFVVGMVAMNKGWGRDRKGFNEAFRAFAQFWRNHPEAVLYCHADWPGSAEGVDLKELARHAGIPEHAIVFPDLYAYFPHGFSNQQMAAAFSAFDVLLAPSHGEGFCVPLIEAQACGTPVIASDFSSQRELAGEAFGAAGWLVHGQPEWDPAQHASYICPWVPDVLRALEEAFTADSAELSAKAQAFAAGYDTDRVFENLWAPFLKTLEPNTEPLLLEREPMPDTGAVAVIVPAMREENLPRLIRSFEDTNDGSARLLIVGDDGFAQKVLGHPTITTSRPNTTYAEKVNVGVENSTEPWVLLVGDDVEFKAGWLEAARKLSDRFDVIGTNDTANGVKNPDVASGKHADHFFVRRSYVDTYGASLEGPGILAPEVYKHWYSDTEVIGLARARNVFTPCLESVIEHHHPGYDGREDLRRADPVYMTAVDHAEADFETWTNRKPLVDMQRTSRCKQ